MYLIKQKLVITSFIAFCGDYVVLLVYRMMVCWFFMITIKELRLYLLVRKVFFSVTFKIAITYENKKRNSYKWSMNL